MITVRERNTPEKQHGLSVALRIRPMMPQEVTKGSRVAYKADDKVIVLAYPGTVDSSDVLRAKRAVERRYEFDCAFDYNCTQEEVYDKTTRALVDDVLEGYNGTIFAYGATGSGKTYTMTGSNDDPGIMVRALSHIFHVAEHSEDIDYRLSLSYAEIYNDNIRDLLNPSSGYLELREDAKGNHQVVGLADVSITSSNEVIRILTRANRQRMQEPTSANRTSSRSHALLQVTIRQMGKRPLPKDNYENIEEYENDEEVGSATNKTGDKNKKRRSLSEHYVSKIGRLYMVDLAGSERASQTQNTGKRLVEGAHINKSLLALGNCINALADRSAKYVNFRDSKLTRLLKVPLSGNCRTVMISHISPALHHFEESRKTLLYASRAKNITHKSFRILKSEHTGVRNNVSDVTHHVAQYQHIISELRIEIQKLQSRISVQDKADSIANKSIEIDKKVFVKRLGNEEMKRIKTELIACFNQQMELRKQLMNTENTLIAIDCDFERLGFMVNEWENETSKINNNNKNETPQYIQQAWEDVRILENEEKRHLQERTDIQKKLEDCRHEAHQLMESLPEKASTEEQRELLNLLTRVHELEIENMEMQASQLIREHELRQREVMILRYDRQRQLCDEIITKQRLMIDDISSGKKHNYEKSRELSELYRLYQQEMQEIINGRDSVIKYISTSNNQRGTGLPVPRPLVSSSSLMDLSGTKSISPFSRLPGIKKDLEDQTTFEDYKNKVIQTIPRSPGLTISEPGTPTERGRTKKLPVLSGDVQGRKGVNLPVDQNIIKGSVGSCRAPTFITLDETNSDNQHEVKPTTLPNLQNSKLNTETEIRKRNKNKTNDGKLTKPEYQTRRASLVENKLK